jgi:hypothetical protein
MSQTTLPRVPGRNFAGVVEAGPSEWITAEVWGTGGDTGFTHDGTHSELIAACGKLAPQAKNPQLRRGGVSRSQLRGRLVRHRSGRPETR